MILILTTFLFAAPTPADNEKSTATVSGKLKTFNLACTAKRAGKKDTYYPVNVKNLSNNESAIQSNKFGPNIVTLAVANVGGFSAASMSINSATKGPAFAKANAANQGGKVTVMAEVTGFKVTCTENF